MEDFYRRVNMLCRTWVVQNVVFLLKLGLDYKRPLSSRKTRRRDSERRRLDATAAPRRKWPSATITFWNYCSPTTRSPTFSVNNSFQKDRETKVVKYLFILYTGYRRCLSSYKPRPRRPSALAITFRHNLPRLQNEVLFFFMIPRFHRGAGRPVLSSSCWLQHVFDICNGALELRHCRSVPTHVRLLHHHSSSHAPR